jgi:transposase
MMGRSGVEVRHGRAPGCTRVHHLTSGVQKRKLICSGCGRKFTDAHDYYQREVRDLPWRKYRATVIIELYRVSCPPCGVRIEKVPQLASKAPFSKDFEDAVGLARESTSVRQVARQFGLAASTVRAIDLRYLERWNATRRKDRLANAADSCFSMQLFPPAHTSVNYRLRPSASLISTL